MGLRETSEQVFDENKSSAVNQYVAALICSSITIMYGQTVGWSSSALPQIEAGILSSGHVGPETSGWVGGALCLGALISSPFHGLIADARGRKFTGYLNSIAIGVNWLIILFADSFALILVARAIAGIAAAGSITLVSIYNNEIAELKAKSAIGGILALAYVSGIESAYIFGAYLSYTNVVIVYLVMNLMWFPLWWMMPETPAHLILHGKNEEAVSAIRWLRGVDSVKANKILENIKSEQEGAVKPATIKEFFSDRAARKGLVIILVIIMSQASCGAMAITSYAGSIFSKAGGGISPEIGAIIYGAFTIAGAILPPLLADRAPRKVLMCISTFVMTIGMITFGSILLYKSYLTPEEEENYSSVLPPIVLAVTIFFYFIGLGSIPYISITELFSDENRGVAGAIIAMAIWVCSFLLLQFYGIAAQTLGDYTVFYFFASITFSCFVFVIFFLPETRGKTFPEIKRLILKEKYVDDIFINKP